MKTLDTFDTFSQSLRPHPSKAQIILQLRTGGPTLDCALEVLRSVGIQEIQYDYLHKGDPFLVVIYISTKDMREAVLKLTEAGFNRLNAINHQNCLLKSESQENHGEK